jgi:hypothetical protein
MDGFETKYRGVWTEAKAKAKAKTARELRNCAYNQMYLLRKPSCGVLAQGFAEWKGKTRG